MKRKLEYIHPSQITDEFFEATTYELYLEATHFSFLPGEDGWDEVKYFVHRGRSHPRLEEGQGYVYVLECMAQPGVCKIGFTTRKPEDRVKEINASTGVIIPWMLSAAYRCTNPVVVEKIVHAELGDYRVNKHKEGFNVSLAYAKQVIERVLRARQDEHGDYVQENIRTP